jgi:adenylate cyclase
MSTRSVERTLAFVDLAGFTALTEAHGDEHAVATLSRFREITEDALGPTDVLVKTIGDAVMLAFDDPELAVGALRRLFDAAAADPKMLLIRAGAHAGSAIVDGNDYLGGTVNLAARVAAHAGEGQLLVTDSVATAATKLGEVITFTGAVSLRNIAEPIDIYEIELNPDANSAVDPVCSMKVPTTGPSTVHLRCNDRDVWFCGLPCLARYAANPEAFARSK